MAAGVRNYGTTSTVGRTVAQAKQSFFDQDKVLQSMDRAAAKALSKFGAFVRQRARTSMRYSDKPSAPGGPAAAHKTQTRKKTNKKGITKIQQVSPFRDGIFFFFDHANKTVIIGPTLWVREAPVSGRPLHGTVPETLEFGGQISILEMLIPAHTIRAGTRGGDGRFRPAGEVPARWVRTSERVSGRVQRTRSATVAQRPTMNLAFAAELPGLMIGFKNSM